ncbi:MAG: outer membrane protein assembly factor BamD [Bacteroidales bacterium]|nr:outer membrane protein assembly factor BamD [Bacteroidales bacterium]
MLKNGLLISALIIVMCCFSCSSYNKLLKSSDYEAKYNAAISYYEKGNYDRALQLFDLLQVQYRGKPEGDTISFLTAECYYYKEDFLIASHYYKRYVSNYAFSDRAEDALYKSAMCYYYLSPKISLDQSDTYTAISEFQTFTDMYPKSLKVPEANAKIDTLRMKIENKDYNTCLLYFKMEEFQAAITTFESFLKEYPSTSHREEILYFMVINYYNYAENSVTSKQRERYELALEKYNTLCYVFPESPYIKELTSIVDKINLKLNKQKQIN